jgi:protein-S-isoprenylcysteine O-methyltransferase Ste14
MLWIKVILLFVLVPGIADVLFPWLILSNGKALTFPTFGVFQAVGLLLITTGLAPVIWVCLEFIRYGHGTPAPFDPPRKFVHHGLYRWVRNPMYLGAGLLIPLGEAVYFGSWWMVLYSAIVMIILHLYIVFREEPELERRYGRPYLKYKRDVSRWIPKLPKK